MNTSTKSPDRLMAGGWRLTAARLRTYTVGAVPIAQLLLVALSPLTSWAVGVGALFTVPATLRLWRAFWWRLAWPFDSRAGGLAKIAERGVNKTYDAKRNDWRSADVEVAPALLRVKCRRGLRTYTVRPLPGQTIEDYRAAKEALRVRWRAFLVEVEPAGRGPIQRGRVRLTVWASDPHGRAVDMPSRFR
jgi:hypothetical protein